MTYAVYCDFVNRISKYHVTGCSRIRYRNNKNGDWHHHLADLDAVFSTSLGHPAIKAVIPTDCCQPESTEARCIGCAGIHRGDAEHTEGKT